MRALVSFSVIFAFVAAIIAAMAFVHALAGFGALHAAAQAFEYGLPR
jgi:hypothetical protein